MPCHAQCSTFCSNLGLCCTDRLREGLPISRTGLSHDLRDGCAARGEAVQDGKTDLKLSDLTIKIPSGQALPNSFKQHLCFDAASALMPPLYRQIIRPMQRDALIAGSNQIVGEVPSMSASF